MPVYQPVGLFTDFGLQGPYVGQMDAAVRAEDAQIPVVHLMHDVPAVDIRAGAWLLAAVLRDLPTAVTIAAVVDPGVGTDRRALILNVDGRWLTGPDNGLFDVLISRSVDVQIWSVAVEAVTLSASFHGRDLFAPLAARLARDGGPVPGLPWPVTPLAPDARVRLPLKDETIGPIYVDRFGNVMLNCFANALPDAARLFVDGIQMNRQRTFADSPAGTLFWYENALGLVELAVNQGNAAKTLRLDEKQTRELSISVDKSQ